MQCNLHNLVYTYSQKLKYKYRGFQQTKTHKESKGRGGGIYSLQIMQSSALLISLELVTQPEINCPDTGPMDTEVYEDKIVNIQQYSNNST